MKALILAGGFATRLWPLTIDKAKPLLPIANKAIISHIVDKIPKDVPIIVSTNAIFSNDFKVWRELYKERDIEIFVEDADSDSGKKGALRAVGLVIETYKINEELLTIGGDNVFDFDFAKMLEMTGGKPTLAAFDVKDLEEAKKYGIVVANGSIITNFEEKPEAPRSTLAGTCCYYFPANTLSHIVKTSFEMPDKLGAIFTSFLEHGFEPRVFPFDGYWNDIGSFRAYVETHVAMGEASVPEKFLAIELGNSFEGVNYIDPSCEIRDSKIKDSIILQNTIIVNCDIHSSIIDKNCEFHNLELYQEIVKKDVVLFNEF
ncbi:hypothetical protein GW765_02760 [Candidatus Parcubacteria bacterium]|uniref:Nucleotidyl transferase domain-containing protein n=1 Tax=Candidatus Uhrbacteria bacterium CG_4_9_14_3_um_filter_41_35 TaxID=1975034 RepID=A0A2M7XD90_9BACT|nr:hypothetical protein [Candidatus Parcubacteria bacterium]PIQ67205.1 MAG: hypothetical protein COV92_04015 [Candidatus Uhrbacteria bacterium CG11_big_fil_rev_8_21_14_0_20_41_9]PJA45792.1 MAG: hypothetical protein CO173_04435 [Candidatus Uhrbacteria bacterium CG_4_9_14_3_um_filter_41_35]